MQVSSVIVRIGTRAAEVEGQHDRKKHVQEFLCGYVRRYVFQISDQGIQEINFVYGMIAFLTSFECEQPAYTQVLLRLKNKWPNPFLISGFPALDSVIKQLAPIKDKHANSISAIGAFDSRRKLLEHTCILNDGGTRFRYLRFSYTG